MAIVSAKEQGVAPVALSMFARQDGAVADGGLPDRECEDGEGVGAPVVRLDVWSRDPISGLLVCGDGQSRRFVGWVSLMAAVDWARDGAAGRSRPTGG